MLLMMLVISWSHDSDASPPRSHDGACEGSQSHVVMGSNAGSYDKKSGRSELDHNKMGTYP